MMKILLAEIAGFVHVSNDVSQKTLLEEKKAIEEQLAYLEKKEENVLADDDEDKIWIKNCPRCGRPCSVKLLYHFSLVDNALGGCYVLCNSCEYRRATFLIKDFGYSILEKCIQDHYDFCKRVTMPGMKNFDEEKQEPKKELGFEIVFANEDVVLVHKLPMSPFGEKHHASIEFKRNRDHIQKMCDHYLKCSVDEFLEAVEKWKQDQYEKWKDDC